MKMENYCIFEYFYCDASGYKSWGEIVLRGRLSQLDTSIIESKFESSEFFIAEQLEIPTLYRELWKFSDGPTADDHVWHTFHKLRLAEEWETKQVVFGDLKDFILKIKSIGFWRENLSPHWHPTPQDA